MSVLSRVAVGRLFEREVELARVDRLLDRMSDGVGAVVVVGGAAGIGKSELLAVVRARSEEREFEAPGCRT